MENSAGAHRKVGQFEDSCFEIQLADDDLRLLKLDSHYVLLELRPQRNEYGAFYSAKGRQWDVWSDPTEEGIGRDRGVPFAMRDPVKAAVELLERQWRPDFDYDPTENE